jgi:hypothetical protein
MESMAFPAPIFTKLTNTQQHYVLFFFFCAKFHKNWTINVQHTDIHSLIPVSKVWVSMRRMLQIQSLIRVLCKSLIPKFIQIRRKM